MRSAYAEARLSEIRAAHPSRPRKRPTNPSPAPPSTSKIYARAMEVYLAAPRQARFPRKFRLRGIPGWLAVTPTTLGRLLVRDESGTLRASGALGHLWVPD